MNAEHDPAAKIDAMVDSCLKDLNEDLKVIKEAKNIDRHVISYVARHSFATNLKHNKVDISIIQEAMGHEMEEMTRTYLEEYDDELVSNCIEEAWIEQLHCASGSTHRKLAEPCITITRKSWMY